MRHVLVAALALWTAGCGKSDKGSSGWTPFELADIGVVVNAPSNAEKNPLGHGLLATEGNSDCSASIHLVVNQSQAYENVLSNVEVIGGAVKDLEKEKTDNDNWVVEFVGERKSGFQRSRRLGDKVVQCGGFGPPDSVACIKKVCASLKLL